MYSGHIVPAVPVAPRINVPALIQQSGLESGWDNSLAAGGVLTFSQASKALCGLSQEVDRYRTQPSAGSYMSFVYVYQGCRQLLLYTCT